MRRVLAILKYVPAVLCGLLVVAWVVSLFVGVGFQWVLYRDDLPHTYSMNCIYGTAYIGFAPECFGGSAFFSTPLNLTDDNWGSASGRWDYWETNASDGVIGYHFSVPLLFLASACVPLGIAPFIRVPLWTYFAWTGLLAAELAYYLR